MNIIIKATGTTLTEAMTGDIEKKMSALEDFLHPEDKLHVELAMDTRHHQSGAIFRAEVKVSPDGYYADATASDMYEAIDLVIPKIRQQLTRSKDKKVSLRRKFGNIKWKFWE